MSKSDCVMPKPSFVCECAEYFNRETEISEGCVECIPCAAWAGTCESVCDCGQCLYTDTPCREPSSEKECTCQFCVLRAEWKEQFDAEEARCSCKENNVCAPCIAKDSMSEVTLMLSEVERMVAKAKNTLATPWQLGMVPHDYTQKRLDYRLLPCLNTLLLVDGNSAWTSAVIEEVKNLLGWEGRSGVRPICGIPDCTCHLRIINSLFAEKMGGEHLALEAQITAAEEARHAARNVCVDAMQVWDNAKFALRVAVEMLEEAKWETDMIISEGEAEKKTLREAVVQAREAATAAGEAYSKAGFAATKPAAEFHRLVEMKKALMAA